MNLRSTVAASATAALAVGGLTLMAAPAQADLVTQCEGHGGDVTLPTPLAVPAGASCFLDGTTVQGDVTVGEGANLHIIGGEIEGDVEVGADGYFDSSDSTIGGEVANTGSYGTHLEETDGAGVSATPAEGFEDGFVFVVDSDLASVDSEAGALYMVGSRIDDGVSATDVRYADVVDSVLRGDLAVTGSEGGGILCDSEVIGSVSYSGGAGPVAVGAGEEDGFCSSVNYVDGDLSVAGVSGGAYIDNNIVGGSLVAADNSPTAEVGDNNRVRGGTETEEIALSTFDAGVEGWFEAHEQDLAGEVEELRGETVDEAMEAGPAF
ncbi:hypothetical protein IDM40_07280 [Nocardiopsis sp. HNM0947]|uniref:Uncharacterized protein n=1 Tax=Nocardiopsis coralli TaxID=2772213 RepID=A0ABR9P3T5_9ACTN|nr:hypothetical protein [Nocardiopsis coralli]MBE2998506.1 hypothetical protein [Nocardiopsis coralli]